MTEEQRPSHGYYTIGNYGLAVGSGGVVGVRVQAFCRTDTKEKPFAVVNDFVASRLGTLAGLPVPPGQLYREYGGRWCYLCMGFRIGGDQLPPVIPQVYCRQQPWEATGVIAFDQWVQNTDRHDQNMAYDAAVGSAIFDHDMSLIVQPRDGDALKSLETGMDLEVKNHLLSRHLGTATYFPGWYNRIACITRPEISRVIRECSELLNVAQRAKLEDFIVHRQSRIREYITRTRDEYSGVASWPLGAGGVSDVD